MGSDDGLFDTLTNGMAVPNRYLVHLRAWKLTPLSAAVTNVGGGPPVSPCDTSASTAAGCTLVSYRQFQKKRNIRAAHLIVPDRLPGHAPSIWARYFRGRGL